MGIFSKIAKGFKKVVKGIGKGIKKVVGGIGKFMDKIGIVGQIGLALVLPGIGSMLGGWATSMAASSNLLIKGAGHLLGYAVQAGQAVGGFFKSVTQGINTVVGETVGAVLNKIPGMDKVVSTLSGGRFDIANKTFESAWKATQTAITDVASAGGNIFSAETYDLGKLATKKVEEAVTEKAVETAVKSAEEVVKEGISPTQTAAQRTQSILDMPTIETNLSSDIQLQAQAGIQQTGSEVVEKAGKSYLERTAEQAITRIKEVPTKAVDYLASEIETAPGDMAMDALQKEAGLGPQVPVQNVYQAYVPTLQQTEDFSLLSPQLQFADYRRAQFKTAMQTDSQLYTSKTYQHRASAFGGGFA